MAIKRFTIELDDASDRRTETIVPEGLSTSASPILKRQSLTSLPADASADETVSPDKGSVPLRAVGRTFPDLIADFSSNARIAATALTFLPFTVFAGRIESVSDMLYPLLTAAALNAVWFGVAWLSRRKD